MNTFQKILNGTDRVLISVSVILVVLAALIMAVSVLWRDVFMISLVWVEETTRFMTIASVFLMIGPLVRKKLHIKILFVYTLFSSRIQKSVDIAISCLGICVCVACAMWSKDLLDLLRQVGAKSISGTPFDPWTWQVAPIVGMGIGAIAFFDELLKSLGIGPPEGNKIKKKHLM